jgi:hypothetical protein
MDSSGNMGKSAVLPYLKRFEPSFDRMFFWLARDYYGEIIGLLLMLKPDFQAEFADHTNDAAGKLSFEERDVSLSHIIDFFHPDNYPLNI